MAVEERVLKNAVRVYLNNGTVDGVVKTVSAGFPTLGSNSTWDAQKVMNIVAAIEIVADKPIYEVQKVQTVRLLSDD